MERLRCVRIVMAMVDGGLDRYESERSEEVTVIPETQLLTDTEDEREEGVDITAVGVPFDYSVPRFPVITFKLRQITFEVVLSDSRVITYDGFIRDDSSLVNHSYPASIHVKDCCFVEVRCCSIIPSNTLSSEIWVEEFCKGAPAHHLNHPEEGVDLVWKCDWIMPLLTLAGDITPPMNGGSECESGRDHEEHTDESGQEDHEKQTDDELAHYTVLFKCIGTTRDHRQQAALERANELLQAKKDDTVALVPEPTRDAKAIAIKCLLDNSQWHRIGYIVCEALDDVHAALQTNAIVSVSFAVQYCQKSMRESFT